MGSPIVLYQFAFSHFNEKVRWTLDYKGLAHERRNVLPGLHERGVRRRSGGPTTTPFLQDGDEPISGSAAIVAHLDARAPSPALFPSDAAGRRETEEWVRWLDEEIGPAVRLALFHEMLDDADFAGRMFTVGQPAWKALPYRKLFPRIAPVLRERLGIDDRSAAAARSAIEAGLQRVDGASRTSGYLVGDCFSAADLTAGSLFFPLIFPPQLSFAAPDVESTRFDAWLARWRNYPGTEYVRSIWARHR